MLVPRVFFVSRSAGRMYASVFRGGGESWTVNFSQPRYTKSTLFTHVIPLSSLREIASLISLRSLICEGATLWWAQLGPFLATVLTGEIKSYLLFLDDARKGDILRMLWTWIGAPSAAGAHWWWCSRRQTFQKRAVSKPSSMDGWIDHGTGDKCNRRNSKSSFAPFGDPFDGRNPILICL